MTRMAPWMLLALVACGPLGADEPAAPPPEAAQQIEPAPEPALPDPTEPRYAATHALIAWRGAVGAKASVTRTEAEAEALAEQLHRRAAEGEPLEELARAHSDGPSAPRGGRLGVYLTGTMVPDFEAAVASVEPGALAPLVRTPFGWHVARRDPVVHARARHIQVSFAGAWRSTATRSRAEARLLLEEAQAALKAGADFSEVARRTSDDVTASVGGDLGEVAPGQMVPAFEDALFALAPGQISEIVETPYGLHLVQRLE